MAEQTNADEIAHLAARARAVLGALPAAESPLTYQQLAAKLALQPPNTIHRVALALEQTMREDANADRPFIAALVISRARNGLPAPGFFDLAARLGRHSGEESGARAREFHRKQLALCWSERGNSDQ